jgi:hypothetical protein
MVPLFGDFVLEAFFGSFLRGGVWAYQKAYLVSVSKETYYSVKRDLMVLFFLLVFLGVFCGGCLSFLSFCCEVWTCCEVCCHCICIYTYNCISETPCAYHKAYLVSVSKETYYSVKRDLKCQKRPTTSSKGILCIIIKRHTWWRWRRQRVRASARRPDTV